MSAEVISIDSAVRQPFRLRVVGKEFTLEFPLSAVIQAEAEVGHSLKTPQDWFAAPAKDIPVLLKVGLLKHHPEDAVEVAAAITDAMGPEMCNEITEALGALAFPRFTAKLEEQLSKMREGKLPNAPSVDVL